MATIPVRQLGALGIITDVAPAELPPNAFSDGINVRFNAGKVQRAPIFRILRSGLTGTVPVFCYGIYTQDGFDSIVYCNNDGSIYAVANGSETNITVPGHTAHVDGRAFTGSANANVIYLNRPDGPPVCQRPTDATFVTLPNWPAGDTCVSLRAFGAFMLALNVTKASGAFSNMVKWSDTVSNNAVPITWDNTDPTHLAGENQIDELKTAIVDGGQLGDTFIIYSHDEVVRMDNIGGEFLFEFVRLPFDNAGLINQNCWVEVDNRHFVWGENDIYVHDGVTKQSLVDQRVRDLFFRQINVAQSGVFFAAEDKVKREILFCSVSGSPDAALQLPNGYCNYAAVYNYANNTWSFRDIPNVSSASTANANTVLTYATCPAGLEYATVGGAYFDQSDSFSRSTIFSLVQDTANGLTSSKLDALDNADTGRLALILDTQAVYPAWVMRTGYDAAEAGGDMRGYKMARALLPQVVVYAPNVTLQVAVGSQLTLQSALSFDSPTSFDPTTMYKVDTRQGGRYLAFKYTMPTANDFALSGHDLDLVVTGKR